MCQPVCGMVHIKTLAVNWKDPHFREMIWDISQHTSNVHYVGNNVTVYECMHVCVYVYV